MIALADRLVRGRGRGPLSRSACRPAALPAYLVRRVYCLACGRRPAQPLVHLLPLRFVTTRG
jgi:hypothetical protein